MTFDDEYTKALEAFEKKKLTHRTYLTDTVLMKRLANQEPEKYPEIDKKIITLLSPLFPVYDEEGFSYKIKTINKLAEKLGNLETKDLYFSKKELDFVHSLKNIDLEKILFILMCFSKMSKYDYFKFTDSALRSESCLGCGKQRLYKMLFTLNEMEILKNKHYKSEIEYYFTENIKNLYSEDDIVLIISDKRNVINYYLKYIGKGSYIFCEKCGKLEKRTSNVQKFCRDCSLKIPKECREEKCNVCGALFSINSRTKRNICEDCQREKDLVNVRKRVQRYRDKNKM